MSQLRAKGANISIRTILPVMAVGLVVWASAAAAQESLGDLVSEAGFDWMIGRWVATTDDGSKIQAVYQWQLNKHLVSMYFKMGEWEGRGMIFYSPREENVVQVGVDSMGGSNKGIWYPEGDRAVARLEYTQPNGQTGKMAIIHSKVDAETMKVVMYGVDESGQLADEPWGTLEYKRQRQQKSKDETETTVTVP